MKYIKTFEITSMKDVEVGYYVFINKDINRRIFKVIRKAKNVNNLLHIISIDDEQTSALRPWKQDSWVRCEKVTVVAKNEEELELYLSANKYNL